jgi:hypothetical protein
MYICEIDYIIMLFIYVKILCSECMYVCVYGICAGF